MQCALHTEYESLAQCTDCNVHMCKLCMNKDDGVPYCDQCIRKKETGKDEMTVLIMCSMFGILGVHRFYTGHTIPGLIQLCTLGGLGIWTLLDFIAIMRHEFLDAEGRPLIRD